jgi:hypothetical protein
MIILSDCVYHLWSERIFFHPVYEALSWDLASVPLKEARDNNSDR